MQRKLEIWEEIIGIVSSIKKENGRLILNFHSGRVISLPDHSNIEQEIYKKKEKRISLLRTDLNNNPYIILEV